MLLAIGFGLQTEQLLGTEPGDVPPGRLSIAMANCQADVPAHETQRLWPEADVAGAPRLSGRPARAGAVLFDAWLLALARPAA